MRIHRKTRGLLLVLTLPLGVACSDSNGLRDGAIGHQH